jgi:hypothetical protein
MFAFVVAGLLSIASTSMSQGVQAGGRADREQIAGIIDSWEQAWNSHDMRALAALFHDDGIWILWTGEVWKGRSFTMRSSLPARWSKRHLLSSAVSRCE